MNLPSIPKTTNTLYIGIGGGYDVFGAIPIHERIQSNAVFVNIGTDVRHMGYYSFYALGNKTGAAALRPELQAIVDRHNIDTIIAVDGGVDCLMKGNEMDSGTVLHDFNTMAAIDGVDVRNKILVCVGFGTETDEGLNHYRVLENISDLICSGAFLGSCSITSEMAEFEVYKAAVDTLSSERKSHIQTKVIAATEGEFGNPDLINDPNLSTGVFDVQYESFINPLMSIYWFFRFDGVVENNLIIPHIKDAKTISEALAKYRTSVTRERDKKTLPL